MTPDQMKTEYHILRDQIGKMELGDRTIPLARRAFEILGEARTQMVYRTCGCGTEAWLDNLRQWPGEPGVWIGECVGCGTTLACGPCKGGKQ